MSLQFFNLRVPDDVVSCPVCGCLMIVVRFGDGRLGILDPTFIMRREIVVQIGLLTWFDWIAMPHGQRWGLGYGRSHECPPLEYSPRKEGPSHARDDCGR